MMMRETTGRKKIICFDLTNKNNYYITTYIHAVQFSVSLSTLKENGNINYDFESNKIIILYTAKLEISRYPKEIHKQ